MNKYDSYKDSGVEWIGEVPSHWKRKRFSYSFNIQKGKIPKELMDVRDDESLPYLSMNVLRGEEPNEFSSGDGLVVVDVNVVLVKVVVVVDVVVFLLIPLNLLLLLKMVNSS